MDITFVVVLAVIVFVVIGIALWWARNRSSTSLPLGQGSSFGLGSALRGAFGPKIDEDSWGRLEEVLLGSDVGVETTAELIEGTKKRSPESAKDAFAALGAVLQGVFAGQDRSLKLTGDPSVILVVGVNGSGKTTTIAKLAKRQLDDGRSVVLGAGDTFRAAAGPQLQTWGERLGVRVVVGQEGGDPASVAYDTIQAARAAGIQVAIIDTAGRLHGKKNLMAELAKIYRVAGAEDISEILIVLDATAGQNGLAQVEAFADVVPLTGIVLTKLDGTARGGIVVAVEKRLGVPVKFVGVGEGMDDLVPFDPDMFVAELLEDG